jgi:hypothetical protein
MMSGLPKAAPASRRQLRGVKHVANMLHDMAADRIGVDRRGVLIRMHAVVEMRCAALAIDTKRPRRGIAGAESNRRSPGGAKTEPVGTGGAGSST